MADQAEKVASEEIVVEEPKTGLEESVEEGDQEMGDDEEQMALEKEEAIQNAVALEVRKWLEEHGTKLFALELSKKRLRDDRNQVKRSIQAIDAPKPIKSESGYGERKPKRQRVTPRTAAKSS